MKNLNLLWLALIVVVAVILSPLQTWLNKRFSKPVSLAIYFLSFLSLALLGHALLNHFGIPHA